MQWVGQGGGETFMTRLRGATVRPGKRCSLEVVAQAPWDPPPVIASARS